MSTTEVSDVFEFHLTPMASSPRPSDLQRLLDTAVAEAAQDTAAVTRASAALQDTASDVGEAVVLLHVVLAKGAANAVARNFVERDVTVKLAKRRLAVSQVTQRNTSGDN